MAKPLPRTERALRAIVERLKTISTAGELYHTDAGASVHRARRSFKPGELPAISVFEVSETTGEGTSTTVLIDFGVAIDVHVKAEQAYTGEQLALAKADIKQALGSWKCQDADSALGEIVYRGATAGSRQDGASTESVSLQYSVKLKEARADPAKRNPSEA
jgi:hypothetical protein